MKYTREELNDFIKEISSLCTSVINCEECPFHSGSGCAFRKNPNMWEELKPEKKIVPFDFSLEEDRNALKGKWIKDYNSELQIIGFVERGDWFPITMITEYQLTANLLLKNFVFADGPNKGKPVGKEVEE